MFKHRHFFRLHRQFRLTFNETHVCLSLKKRRTFNQVFFKKIYRDCSKQSISSALLLCVCVCFKQAVIQIYQVCFTQKGTRVYSACVPAFARAAFSSGPWLVEKCSFPCWSSNSRSVWGTHHLLSVFSPSCLLLCCTFSCSCGFFCFFFTPPLSGTLLLSLSSPVSNYHSSVFPQPLHYIQDVITV